jgi:signal transduction histidine kinase
LPAWARPLHPLVNFVARIRASVHTKLLAGFLIGALLLLGIAVLSLVVINRMGQQVEELARLQENMDHARRMEYLITAQSHFRAMALLTNQSFYNDSIALAKTEFLERLYKVESTSRPERAEFFNQVREANNRFATSSAKVLSLYEAGEVDKALALHIAEEHEVSHEIEDAMRVLQADASSQMDQARAQVESDRGRVAALVWAFSGVSLAVALLLGLVLAWAFVRPVRRISHVVEAIAGGDFTQQVAVPNRDEFGTLSRNVNRMSQQLANLYQELQLELAERKRVEEQLAQHTVTLEATNRELETFSYSVSHDLRSPLRSIDGFSLALLEDCANQLDEEGKAYLHRIRAASQHMAELIDALLALSRLTRSKISYGLVDLSALARSISSSFQEMEPERRVEFVIADGLAASGNDKLLRAMLENLLGNAWKFTSKSPQARIELAPRSTTANWPFSSGTTAWASTWSTLVSCLAPSSACTPTASLRARALVWLQCSALCPPRRRHLGRRGSRPGRHFLLYSITLPGRTT